MVSIKTELSQHTFNRIFEEYYRPIRFFALQLTKDEQQAEDIASECFHKLWLNRSNFEDIPAIKSFLYTVAKNTALNYLKSQKIRSVAHNEILYLSEHTEDFILAKIIKSQLLGHIYEKVEKMPPKVREVFNLIYRDGLSIREISEKLCTTEQNVRNVKTRALNLLRRSLTSQNLV